MNSFFALACLATLAFASAILPVDYCKLNCQDSGAIHVACNKTETLGSNCPEGTVAYDFADMDSLRKVILNSHNTKRNIIASCGQDIYPKATRMPTMQWDPELALLAYYGVKECDELDSCRRTNRYNKPGQNSAAITMTTESKIEDLIEKAITGWYNTYRFSSDPVGDIQSFPEKSPNDFEHPAAPSARLIIDNSAGVGCAAVEIPGDEKVWKFICNYSYDTEVGKTLFASGPVVGSGCSKSNNYYKNLCCEADTDKYLQTLPA